MDLKTSLLVNRQLPEFVREEYPLFVSFLEAYYQFLETEQFTNNVSQKNNVTEKLKDLRYIADVDFSLDEFEDQFFNTFLSYIPKDTLVSKDFLIKNILPLYRSKGTEKSFKFLFRILFGEEIDVEYPGEKILRASDGRWIIESNLRVEEQFYSEYISNGQRTKYYLPYEFSPRDIKIYVDDVLQSLNINYYIRQELNEITFFTAPSLNANIKVYYPLVFDDRIFFNRQVTGKTSGAKALIERIGKRSIGGLDFYQFFINNKNTVGTFSNGEFIELTVVTDKDVIPFTFELVSDVLSIEITNPGTSYNVGDPIEIRGTYREGAIAVIDNVDNNGNIISMRISTSGRGYTSTPYVNLRNKGDGNATANATLRPSFMTFPGRWLSPYGLLSNDEIRLQGNNYYIDFSYVISSKIEFQRYKDVVKNILNPVGTINYARYTLFDEIDVDTISTVFDEFNLQVAGTVDVSANYPTVWGTNTYFEVANSIGLLTEGSYIIVNSEIRIVNTIINNTTILVSEPFEYNANNQLITLRYVPYRAITTEYYRELAITLEGPRTVVITTEEPY